MGEGGTTCLLRRYVQVLGRRSHALDDFDANVVVGVRLPRLAQVGVRVHDTATHGCKRPRVCALVRLRRCTGRRPPPEIAAHVPRSSESASSTSHRRYGSRSGSSPNWRATNSTSCEEPQTHTHGARVRARPSSSATMHSGQGQVPYHAAGEPGDSASACVEVGVTTSVVPAESG